MTQGTTPTFTLTLPSTVDLTAAAHVVFTVRQGSAVVEVSDYGLNITGNTVEVRLEQEDTLQFQIYSEAKIQLNWTYSDGSRGCTKIKTVPILENLHDEVIE